MDRNFFKKNKYTVIAIVVFIILFILLIQLKNLFFASSNDKKYGNRLNNIIEITEDEKNDVINKLKENKSIKEVTYDVKGARINLFITINDDVTLAKAKEIGNSVIPLINEDKRKVYDIEVYLIKEDKSLNNFPIIGYKNKNKDTFTYSKDRDITKSE